MWKIMKSLVLTVDVLFAVDSLYRAARCKRCRVYDSNAVEGILHDFADKAVRAYGYAAIKRLISQARRKIRALPERKTTDLLRVAIVGEIFVTSDSFSNLDIERKLGHMGVEIITYMGPASWVREHLLSKLNPFQKDDLARELSREYWNVDDIGGHGVQTVGNSVLSSRRGYDGIIHLYPLTCMPEIAAQSAFSAIQDRYGVPIMTLVVDEMTGAAGYNTRLEAFVDMLRMRKQYNKNN
jgi:predicted nucleotide-binding protein (sugar kinase/HSP70/actin superfamily)